LNFIEEPSIKNGVLAGSECHDKHGSLLSLYDLNYAPKNIFTKQILGYPRDLAWLPLTDQLAFGTGDELNIYSYDAAHLLLSDPGAQGSETINQTLMHNRQLISEKTYGGVTNIKSVCATNKNELLLGLIAHPGIASKEEQKYFAALTTPVGEDQISFQGEPVKMDWFRRLVISPSGEYMMAVTPESSTVYSIKR
jgi:hypothetical protein